jgi:pimeloyl-ACP methyl ester carboxylesterase
MNRGRSLVLHMDASRRFDRQFRTVHGYRRAFVHAGRGPALLLIHGIGDSSQTWRDVIPVLARNFTVIAPDLLGHGMSDKPRADYAVAAYACGMRDLLGVLDIEQVTVVGHSLGGGVAMQFAYQFPERCQRLVLVSSGGVGRDVNALLRLVATPAADLLLPLISTLPARVAGRVFAAVLARAGTKIGSDADDLLRGFDILADVTSRSAFLRTLRAVVDHRGQVVTMLDRCYLAQGMPTLLIWGARDGVIPVEHANIAHAAMLGSRLEIFENAGHFPHHADPKRFVAVLREFLATTQPASYSAQQWRALLRAGRPDSKQDASMALAEETIAANPPSAT